jgi:hypothetical protein
VGSQRREIPLRIPLQAYASRAKLISSTIAKRQDKLRKDCIYKRAKGKSCKGFVQLQPYPY